MKAPKCAILTFGTVIAVLALKTGTAIAEQKSADAIAKELSNPAGALASLANNIQYTTYKGDLRDANSQSAWSYSFQPVLPFPVGNKGRRIIFRPLISVPIDQPVFHPGHKPGQVEDDGFDDLNANLADTTFDLVYAGTDMTDPPNKKGYLWGLGVAGTVPTATNNNLGGDQWRFGPEFFGGIIRRWGLAGALVSNQWNLGGGDGGAGSNDQDYSMTTAQYFYAISMRKGWQIAAAPVVTYNWKSEKNDNALTLPLGVGLAKTTVMGSQPWKFQGQIQYYVEQPDAFGPEWLFKLTITPVIKNPFL